MKWAGLVLSATASLSVAVGCFPDREFSETDPSSGAGASPGTGAGGVSMTTGGGTGLVPTTSGHMTTGGGTGGNGGAPTTSTGGFGGDGGTPVVPTVNCQEGEILCSAGWVCCFDDTFPYSDVCANSGACPANYYQMTCDGHEDCGGATPICCGTFSGITLVSTNCKAACGGADRPTCQIAANCTPSTCDEYWPGYEFCNVP